MVRKLYQERIQEADLNLELRALTFGVGMLSFCLLYPILIGLSMVIAVGILPTQDPPYGPNIMDMLLAWFLGLLSIIGVIMLSIIFEDIMKYFIKIYKYFDNQGGG